MSACARWLGLAMGTMGDALEGWLQFARETHAPLIAASWALLAFLILGFLIRLQRDSFGWKLGASLLAVGGAAGALLWWSLQPGHSYYFFVDEVAANTAAINLRRAPIKVHGCVVVGSLEQRKGTLDYRFWIEGRPDRPSAVIAARYTGVLPDAFHPGAEIVARGNLADDGGLDIDPDGIMAKCPSKYAFDPDSPHDDRRCGEP
jgi:cytochrome c-type biogenesis protein CcmE